MTRPGAAEVLVAHDANGIGGALRLILHQLGKLDLSLSFSEGGASLDTNPVQPQLVIFDPALVGTAPVPGVGSGLTIVAIDSKPTPEQRQHCEDSDVAAYFSAPFKMGEVFEGIDALLKTKKTVPGRSHRRVPVSLTFEFGDAGSLRHAMSYDVSISGVFLATDEPLPLGSTISLRASVAATMVIEGVGEVVRVVRPGVDPGQPGMGVRFDELFGDTREFIDALVSRQRPTKQNADAQDSVAAIDDGPAELAGAGAPDGLGPFATELVAWSELVQRAATKGTVHSYLERNGFELSEAPEGVEQLLGGSEDPLGGLDLRKLVASRLVVLRRNHLLLTTTPHFSEKTAVLVTRAAEDFRAAREVAVAAQTNESIGSEARGWAHLLAEALLVDLAQLRRSIYTLRILATPSFRKHLQILRSHLLLAQESEPQAATDSARLLRGSEGWELGALARTVPDSATIDVEVDEVIVVLQVTRLLITNPLDDTDSQNSPDTATLTQWALDFVRHALDGLAKREDVHPKRYAPVARALGQFGELLESRLPGDPGRRQREELDSLKIALGRRTTGTKTWQTKRASAGEMIEARHDSKRRKTRDTGTAYDLDGAAGSASSTRVRLFAAIAAAALLPVGAYSLVQWVDSSEAPAKSSVPDLRSLAPIGSVRIATVHGGDMLMGTVTPEWDGLNAEDRRAAVERLIAAMPLKKLVLRNADNEVVVRYDSAVGLTIAD